MNGYSGLETDKLQCDYLSKLIYEWLEERRLKAAVAKSWMRFKKRYWWNYYYINGVWWGFEIDNEFKVRRVV